MPSRTVRIVVNVIDQEAGMILAHTDFEGEAEASDLEFLDQVRPGKACKGAVDQLAGQIMGFFLHHTRGCADAPR